MKNLIVCIVSIGALIGGFVTLNSIFGLVSGGCLLYWFLEFGNKDSVTYKSFNTLSQGNKTDFQRKVSRKTTRSINRR